MGIKNPSYEMIESIKYAEYEWFLWLNSFHNTDLDRIMYWASHRFTWIPLYLFLIFLIYKSGNFIQKIGYIVFSVGLADRITSGLMKPYFQRLRPCHDEAIKNILHLNGNCGGLYGFVSSHAANCFALSVCFLLLFHRKSQNSHRILIFYLFLWAILVSYSRIYNGVHYPTDTILGGLVGAIIAIMLFKIINKLTNHKLQTNS